jgi:hypothetical protein
MLLEYFIWKMLDLQHQYNNCTTIPHMRVGFTGAHPHVRGCCTVVVLVLYKNQISFYIILYLLSFTTHYLSINKDLRNIVKYNTTLI